MSVPGTLVDALTTGPALVGSESIPGMRGGLAYRWTPAQFATYVAANLGGAPAATQVLMVDEGTGVPVWAYPYIPQIIKSGDYTFVLADAARHCLHPAADTTPRTWTIPANASVAYRIGTTLTFVNQFGAGSLTIAITSDTMRLSPDGTTGTRTIASGGMATALKITATEWTISGSGLS